MKIKVNPVEDMTGLILRLCIGNSAQHLQQLGLRETISALVIKLRKRRELFLVDSHDTESGITATDQGLIIIGSLHLYTASRKFTDDVCQFAHGQSDSTCFTDFSGHLTTNTQIQVGGSQGNLTSRSFDQHIAENGHWWPWGNDVEN